MVEVLSGSTRRRDHQQKKELYVEAGVADYWIVDPERRSVTVVHSGAPDRVEHERLTWSPLGAVVGLVIHIADIFG